MNSLNDVWQSVCVYCKQQINEVTFNTWLAELKLVDIYGTEMKFMIKTNFQKKIILENYKGLLEDAFEWVLKFPVKITINTEEDEEEETPLSVNNSAQYEYTFDTFIVGGSNRFAHAASLAVAENPAVVYNPLFIYGNSGLGKTHLLNAIDNRIKEKYPDKIIASLSCETFGNDFINSLREGTINEFREKYRNVDVLLIDDIQFIAGKTSTQEEFFNTFNTLYGANKQMVIVSDRPPKDIATLDDRLRSRFEQGLIADIQPPEFETRVGIIQRKAQLLNFDLSDDIVFFIAEQVKSNIRQLEGVVKKLQAFSMLSNEPMTIGVAQGAIRDIRNDNQPEPVTVKKIVSEVSRTYSVSDEDIFSQKQDGPISKARQIAMYVVREVTQMSYKAIGEEFGGRDHTTVLYGIKQIKKKIDKDPKEKNLVNDIIKNLENR
ncbi:MAG: chromosomal replication initiator protein DnaA [Clostridia bacterium]|nr:chromosomal replication initiator protein DnaA [Clostridia bacterium]